MSRITSKLKAKMAAKAPQDGGCPHVIVVARAGTGKTSTCIEGLKVLKGLAPAFEPSPQQQAIWHELMKSRNAATIVAVAFNKSIAVELQSRVPMGVDAMTLHSMGFKAVTKAFGRLSPTQWNVPDIIGRLLRKDPKDLRRESPVLLKATSELVSKCKFSLSEPTPGNLDALASHYDVELNGTRSQVYDLVPQVLEQCKRPRSSIDFDDMVWLPVILNLPLFRYDLLIQDEAQDLSQCQQQLAIRSGKRIIAVGDPMQALYSFAGADIKSIQRLQETLGTTKEGCITLPLTVTRRCGKAVVKEAKKYVPDFEAHESNCDGIISTAKYPLQGKKGDKTEVPLDKNYMSRVEDGDFVICRTNAPLVSQCFRFLKLGRKATIQGRDIGQGILSLIDKMKATSAADLVARISEWYHKEVEKEEAKRNPSDTRLIALEDKYACLVCFCESLNLRIVEAHGGYSVHMDKVNGEPAILGSYKTEAEAKAAMGGLEVAAIRKRVENVFTDDKNSPGVRLSSIHRVKGLEAKRVFFLMPEEAPCPHPMAKSTWQREAEVCCLYVGITRAIEELVFVS